MITKRLDRLVPAMVAAAVLTGCGSTQTSAPTTSTTSISAESLTASMTADGIPDTASSGAGTGDGCAPTAVSAPPGASPAPTGDVDLDGRPDTVWLATSPDRTVGITTASGATFATSFTSAAPQQATAIAQKLQPAGPAVLLLNTGRSVELYAVIECSLVRSVDAEGKPYIFDLGFAGFGTGVGCVAGGDEEDLSLAGLNVQDTGNGLSRVTQTIVTLNDGGRLAANGATTVVAEGVTPDNPYVLNARTVACGNQIQGAVEAQ